MRVLAKIRGGANHHVEAVDSSIHSQSGIVHVAANVGQDLGLEAELADGLTIHPRLLGGGRGGELDVVDTELVESPGNLDLGLGIEEGIGKLLALTKGGLDWGRAMASAGFRCRQRGARSREREGEGQNEFWVKCW